MFHPRAEGDSMENMPVLETKQLSLAGGGGKVGIGNISSQGGGNLPL